MSVTIERASDADEWNDILDRSPQAMPFHRYECLEVCADHSGATLHPYVGYEEGEPTGVFPIFEMSKGPSTAVFSPPPSMDIPYLGPALVNVEGRDRRERERRNAQFVGGALERIERQLRPRFLTLRTGTAYDERPFVWAGHDAIPRYTYVIDLATGEDELLSSFSKDARRNARTDESEYDVYEGGAADVERVTEGAIARKKDRDLSALLRPAFVGDLYRALPEGMVRAHVCEQDGQFRGGVVTLELGDTVYGWQTFGDQSSGLPVGDLLHWHVMRDAKRRGKTNYDLVGANDRRRSEYKSKFGPDLREYYELRRGSLETGVTAKLFQQLQ